jgi:hypothetical protein
LHHDLPKHLQKAVSSVKQTTNSKETGILYDTHHDGITPILFEKYDELKQFCVIAHGSDRKGMEYVAAYEHRDYPIYCVQYHPEKAPFVDLDYLNIPKCEESKEIAYYYSNFFISE